MQNSSDLLNMLRSIHRKSYPAYKSLRGVYRFDRYTLSIDHVQGDPFASPSHISIRVPLKDAGFPSEYHKDAVTRRALCDFLTRQFARQINRFTFQAKGSGKSGLISVSRCGQEVLTRTACEITDKEIVSRFFIGFPANGRTINARELEKILFDFLPRCVQETLCCSGLDSRRLRAVAQLADAQQYIRQKLPELGLCAFVADGSILPRESGVCSRPMKGAVPFRAPRELAVPEYMRAFMRENDMWFTEVTGLEAVIPQLDVLYMTRIQRERFVDPLEYERNKGIYILTRRKLGRAKKELLVMHPLPRVDEIDIDVDDDPRAVYFDQARYGMFARMALLTDLANQERYKPEPVEIGTKPVCSNPNCITQTELYLPPLVKQNGGVDCCAFCDAPL